MKAVLWTDTFQSVIIVGGLTAALVQGSNAVGGILEAWGVAEEHSRIYLTEYIIIIMLYGISLMYFFNSLSHLQISHFIFVFSFYATLSYIPSVSPEYVCYRQNSDLKTEQYLLP